MFIIRIQFKYKFYVRCALQIKNISAQLRLVFCSHALSSNHAIISVIEAYCEADQSPSYGRPLVVVGMFAAVYPWRVSLGLKFVRSPNRLIAIDFTVL